MTHLSVMLSNRIVFYICQGLSLTFDKAATILLGLKCAPTYSFLPYKRRVSNNSIGLTFIIDLINVQYGINVLGGENPEN